MPGKRFPDNTKKPDASFRLEDLFAQKRQQPEPLSKDELLSLYSMGLTLMVQKDVENPDIADSPAETNLRSALTKLHRILGLDPEDTLEFNVRKAREEHDQGLRD